MTSDQIKPTRWARSVIFALIVAFVAINAFLVFVDPMTSILNTIIPLGVGYAIGRWG